MRFHVYQDDNRQWRWRLLNTDGEPVAVSGRGYQHRGECRASIGLVTRTDADTTIVESA